MLSKLHSVGPGFDRCRNMTLFPNSEFRFKLSSFTQTLIDFTQALNALSLSCNFSVFPVAYIANASHVAFTESRLFLTVSNTYWFYLVLVFSSSLWWHRQHAIESLCCVAISTQRNVIDMSLCGIVVGRRQGPVIELRVYTRATVRLITSHLRASAAACAVAALPSRLSRCSDDSPAVQQNTLACKWNQRCTAHV